MVINEEVARTATATSWDKNGNNQLAGTKNDNNQQSTGRDKNSNWWPGRHRQQHPSQGSSMDSNSLKRGQKWQQSTDRENANRKFGTDYACITWRVWQQQDLEMSVRFEGEDIMVD